MSLQFTELRLYNASASTFVLLPDFSTVAFDVKHNDLGVITFNYPAAAAKAAGLTDNSLVGVVGTDGTQDPKEFERYLVFGTKEDKVVDGTPMRTFEGKSTLNILDDANVYPSNWDPVTKTGTVPLGHEFVETKIGTIWRTLILRAKNRGCFPNLSETSFDGLSGSDGIAWNMIVSQNYGGGESYVSLLLEQMQRGLVDAWMEGWSLRLQNGGTRGSHIGIGTLELRAAKNVTEIGVSTDTTDSASTVFIAGDDGVAIERHSAPAQALLGRRRERSISQQGISDIGTLTILGDAELSTSGRIPTEETIGVSSALTPFFDFNIADWVWVRLDSGEDPVERRIWQIAVSVDENRTTTVGITANSILYEDDIKTKRKVDAYTGAGGTYGSVGSGVDTSIPNPPSGALASSEVYLSNSGGYAAVVLLQWSAPTTNVGGSSITDLDHYEVEWKYDAETDYTVQQVAQSPGRISPVLPGSVVDLRVRAVDTAGNKSAYLTKADYTVNVDTTAPDMPSTPVLSTVTDGVLVEYDGLTSTSGAMPTDLARVEIWHSSSSGFVPGDAGSSYAGFFATGAGVRSILGEPLGEDTYVRLVAVDIQGNRSAPSAQSASFRGGPGDGFPPGASPSATLSAFAVGGLQWRVTPLANEDTQYYKVWADTDPSVPDLDADHLVADTSDTQGTFFATDGGPLIPSGAGSEEALPVYYVRVLAYDLDGPAASGVSAPSAGVAPRRAGQAEFSADIIYAGRVELNQIVGGTADFQMIVGDEIATDKVGKDRVGLDSAGFFADQFEAFASGTLTSAIGPGDGAIAVGSVAAGLTEFPYAAVIEVGTLNEERMTVVGGDATQVFVERDSGSIAHASGVTIDFLQRTRNVDVSNTGSPTFRGRGEFDSAVFNQGFEARGQSVGGMAGSLRLAASLPSPTAPVVVTQFNKETAIPSFSGSKPPGTVTRLSESHPIWDAAGGRWLVLGVFTKTGSLSQWLYWWSFNPATGVAGWSSTEAYISVTAMSLRGVCIVGTRILAGIYKGGVWGLYGWDLASLDVVAPYQLFSGALSQANAATAGVGSDGVGVWVGKVALSAGTHEGLTSLAVGQTYLTYQIPTFTPPNGFSLAAVSRSSKGYAIYTSPNPFVSGVVAQSPANAGKAWADYGAWIDTRVLTSNVVTMKTKVPHALVTGQLITVSGEANAAFNGNYTVTSVPDRWTFTYAKTNANIASATATTGTQVGSQSRFWLTIQMGSGEWGFGASTATFRIPASPSLSSVAEFEGSWYGDPRGLTLVPGLSATPWLSYFWMLAGTSDRLLRNGQSKNGDLWMGAYTWSDDDVTGARHESLLSPWTEFFCLPRMETRFQSGAIPVPYDYPNTPATPDDPKGVRFYLRNKSTSDSPANAWRLMVGNVLGGNGHVSAAYGSPAVLSIDNQYPPLSAAPAYNVDTGLTRAPVSNSFAASIYLTNSFRVFSDVGGLWFDGLGRGSIPLLEQHFIEQTTLTTPAQPNSTANVTLAGLSTTVDCPGASAVYRVQIDASVRITVTGTLNIIELLVDGNTYGDTATHQIVHSGAANQRGMGVGTWRITGLTAGSHTFTARTRNSAASTGADVLSAHTVMTVERKQ